MFSSGGGLLLQKVCTDCPGDFSWCLFVDPEVIEGWKSFRFRVRENRCKLLHGQIDPCDMGSPAVHKQNIRSDVSVGFIMTVKPSKFPMFAQIFREEAQHLLPILRTEEKRKQQLHEPTWGVAGAIRASTE